MIKHSATTGVTPYFTAGVDPARGTISPLTTAAINCLDAATIFPRSSMIAEIPVLVARSR